ncbi:MAG: hypothetical protein PHQ43_06660 [Dehalococcoidales bacterium]|nr:hypothetical protein [Dehalococcoidales bacterium]
MIIPVFPSGQRLDFTGRPETGTYAWIEYKLRFGTAMVPNTFAVEGSQYGTRLYSGVLTEELLARELNFFVLITEQEPSSSSVTNVSPLAQYYEASGEFLLIPTLNDMKVITDALRRLHTSQESERLLQQADYLLGLLVGEPTEPMPPVGGS